MLTDAGGSRGKRGNRSKASVGVYRVLSFDTAPASTCPSTRTATPNSSSSTNRLEPTGLEQLRDFFDRRDLGLILTGMPGFDPQLARYSQLYNRIVEHHCI